MYCIDNSTLTLASQFKLESKAWVLGVFSSNLRWFTKDIEPILWDPFLVLRMSLF